MSVKEKISNALGKHYANQGVHLAQGALDNLSGQLIEVLGEEGLEITEAIDSPEQPCDCKEPSRSREETVDMVIEAVTSLVNYLKAV